MASNSRFTRHSIRSMLLGNHLDVHTQDGAPPSIEAVEVYMSSAPAPNPSTAALISVPGQGLHICRTL